MMGRFELSPEKILSLVFIKVLKEKYEEYANIH
jgi:hypothetical protein